MDVLLSPKDIEYFSISFVEQQNGSLIFLCWNDTIATLKEYSSICAFVRKPATLGFALQIL